MYASVVWGDTAVPTPNRSVFGAMMTCRLYGQVYTPPLAPLLTDAQRGRIGPLPCSQMSNASAAYALLTSYDLQHKTPERKIL